MLRLGMSGAGALLWSGLYLMLTAAEFSSLAAAVAFHEMGHILLLLILDSGVDTICLTGTGLRIDCSRGLTPFGEILAAIAGPAFGLLWCMCAWNMGLHLSCGLSAVLTLCNLVPLSYLDGGRVLHGVLSMLLGTYPADRAGRALDVVICILFCAFSMFCAANGTGVGLAVTAAWLTLYTLLHNKKALI